MADIAATIAARFGNDLPPEGPVQLGRFLAALRRTPLSVTTVREPEAALERHIADTLRALPVIDALPAGPIVDVGSGGGIPGLVLAAARPERAVHLVEATGRKAAFLAETASAMGVSVEVHAARSEDLGRGSLRDAAAAVCARALAAPPAAAELCLPLTAPGGATLLWVGADVEPAEVAAAATALAGGPPTTPAPGLLLVPKLGPTPELYPRRAGMAAKRPLR